MVDSQTGLVIVAIIWFGGALAFAAGGRIVDSRVLYVLALLWLLGLGFVASIPILFIFLG